MNSRNKVDNFENKVERDYKKREDMDKLVKKK